MGYIRDRAVAALGALRNHMSEQRYLALLGILVGALAGFAAAMLKDLITALSALVKGIFPIDQLNILLFIVPVIGILICGIFCRYVIKDDMEFGCQRILKYLNSGNFALPRHLTYAPAIACALTIGFGGSAGSEGPIAYTGAGIGSNVGKFFRLPADTLRTLVIIGAAAGIAGIFKAPIGGSIFALEVLGMSMTTVSVITLIFACLSAAFVAYAWSGFSMDIAYLPKNFFQVDETAAVILLGIACGIYSLYYSKMGAVTERAFLKIKNPWIKNLTSGILVGSLIFLFPALYGEGYELLTQIINGSTDSLLNGSVFYHIDGGGAWVIIAFLLGTVLVKTIATYATNSGGGVGGDFAPTLFAGCMAGLLFAYASNHIFGTQLHEANFALFGMAAVMSGAIQAPLMAIFLTAEMVGDIGMFFPLTIASLFSFATVRLLSHHLNISLRPSWLHRIHL